MRSLARPDTPPASSKAFTARSTCLPRCAEPNSVRLGQATSPTRLPDQDQQQRRNEHSLLLAQQRRPLRTSPPRSRGRTQRFGIRTNRTTLPAHTSIPVARRCLAPLRNDRMDREENPAMTAARKPISRRVNSARHWHKRRHEAEIHQMKCPRSVPMDPPLDGVRHRVSGR